MYNWPSLSTGSGYYMPMMWGGYQNGGNIAGCPMMRGWAGGLVTLTVILYILGWIMLMVVLYAAARYLWKKAGK